MIARLFGRTIAGCAAICCLLVSGVGAEAQAPLGKLNILVVLDGLRPDYVTPELMPNLVALAADGVQYEHHHSVYPTLTRVNSASFSTGCYPSGHGIMGNTVWFPKVGPKPLTTASLQTLRQIEAAEGELLTAPTLGELLQTHGKKLVVVGAGSEGSAYLLNHKISGGAVIHNDFTLPESLHEAVLAAVGPPAPEGYPATDKNRRAVDAVLKIAVDQLKADVVYLWLTDPDHTAHSAGIGSELANRSIRQVDAEIARLIEGLEARGLKDSTNLFVTSDHGFSTHTGGMNLESFLLSQKLKASADSTDVVVSGDAIYVREGGDQMIHKIVYALQKVSWAGAIFTRSGIPGHPEGFVPGTLALELAQWKHPRGGDILVSAQWTDEKNEAGYPGTSTQSGLAGHGTTSPYDIHNTCIVWGVDVRRGEQSKVPSGNVDFAPTFLFLNGIDRPKSMHGRVLHESLNLSSGPKRTNVSSVKLAARRAWDGGEYSIDAQETSVELTNYLDFVKARREGDQ